MHAQHATRLRGHTGLDHRASGSNHERNRGPTPARAPNLLERVGTEHDVDCAFLDWFEARLASDGPDIRDVNVLDYLVALALYDRTWVSGADH